MNALMRNIGVWLVIGLVVTLVVKQFEKTNNKRTDLSYTEMMEQVYAKRVAEAYVDNRTIRWKTTDGKEFVTFSTGSHLWMVDDMIKNGVKVSAKPEEEQNLLASVLINWFPMLLIIGFWLYFMRQMQGGGGRNNPFGFGRSKAKLLDENNNAITFADVAGCDEAKQEVAEIVDFLRDPSKFQSLGGRIPRGVLMVGVHGLHRQWSHSGHTGT